jgi:hypothetical protein
MRHDFAAQPNSEETERFRKWLDTETTGMLQRSYGDSEKTEAAIFLFCQRAYEAHMPEMEIAEMFALCVLRAGFNEQEEQACFDWLDFFAQLAANVHR